MPNCEHDYSGVEVDTQYRRVCLRCLQPAPTVTIARERLEAMLRDAWMRGDTWDRSRPQDRDTYIARALAEIDGWQYE